MNPIHQSGKVVGHVMLYALSTCVWCKKTKRLLDELGIEYYYVDVDLLADAERAEAQDEIDKWNPTGSFPTIVVDELNCISGYQPEDIRGLADQ